MHDIRPPEAFRQLAVRSDEAVIQHRQKMLTHRISINPELTDK
ncbi:MAG: hypothetical protein ACOYNL_09960 [Rickettsiales bacterium]